MSKLLQKLWHMASRLSITNDDDVAATLKAAADIIEALDGQVDEYARIAAQLRAETDARIDAQAAEIGRLREALTAIDRWEVPLVEFRGEAVSMSVAYGSNGVRDYFRGVARAALSGEGE